MAAQDTRRGLIALTCVMILLLSTFASYPVGAAVTSGGTVAGNSGPAPSVEIPDATIDDSTPSEIEVAYNASGTVPLSDLELVVTGPDGFYASVTESRNWGFTSKLTSKSGTVNLTIPADRYEGGNFTLDVRLVNDATNDRIATDTSRLTVSTPVTVQSVSLDKSTAYEGKNFTVTTVLYNPPGSAENYTVSTKTTSEWGFTSEAKAETVTVPADSHLTVTHNASFSNPGSHSIQVNRQPSMAVTVEQSPISIEEINVNRSSVSAGDDVEVNITASNSLQSSYTETIKLQQNSTTLATRDVTFAAGETKNVSFTKTMNVLGGHALSSGMKDASVVVSSSDVVVEGFTLSSNPIYTNDPITITAEVNNTGSSSKKFSVVAWKDGEQVGNAQQVSLGANEQKSIQIQARGYNFYQAGSYDITVNQESPKSLTVNEAVEFKGMHLSDETPAAGQPVTINLTYKNVADSQRKKTAYLWADSSHSKDLTLQPGETKNASFQVSFTRSGPHYLWAEGTSGKLFVLNDTTGTANVSVTNVFEPGMAVNNSTTFIPVEVTNDGDASGIKNVSLTVDGTVVDHEKVYADPGESRTVGLMHTFTSKGEYSVSVDTASSSRSFSVNVTGPVVVDGSVSVSHVGGTQPSQLPVVAAEYSGGHIGFQISNGQQFGYDLSEIGADSTTKLRINLTVRNFTPRILVSSGKNLEWTRSPGPRANETNVSITVHPSQLDFKTRFEGGYPSSPTEWDASVKNDTADFGWDAAILMGMGDATGDFVDADASDLDGMRVSTDAQLFSMPTYVSGSDGQPDQLRIPLAAPHKTVNGNVNDGYYEAFIPDSLLEEWGVNDPESELVASYTGASNTNLTVTDVSGGAIVNLSLHYSSGTVSIAPTSSGGGGGGGGNTGSNTGSSTPSTTQTTDDSDDDDSGETSVSVGASKTNANGTQTASASVKNAKANSTVSLSFDDESDAFEDAAESSADAALDELNISLSDDADFDVDVSTSTDAPEEAASTPTPDGNDVVSYVQIDHAGLTDDQISAAALTMRVKKDRFGDEFDPANAVVYRLHDGEWTELETTLIGETATHYRFRADSPGLSVFAIGEKQPDLSSTLSLSTTTAAVGEDVTVEVTVTNDGTGQGTYTAELTANGESVVTKTVTVPAGETATLSIGWEFGAGGDYVLSVNGEDAGTVTVESIDRTTTTPSTTTTTTTTATATESPTTTAESPGFGIIAGLLALLAAARIARD